VTSGSILLVSKRLNATIETLAQTLIASIRRKNSSLSTISSSLPAWIPSRKPYAAAMISLNLAVSISRLHPVCIQSHNLSSLNTSPPGNPSSAASLTTISLPLPRSLPPGTGMCQRTMQPALRLVTCFQTRSSRLTFRASIDWEPSVRSSDQVYLRRRCWM
jgi:hypothetical protein